MYKATETEGSKKYCTYISSKFLILDSLIFTVSLEKYGYKEVWPLIFEEIQNIGDTFDSKKLF